MKHPTAYVLKKTFRCTLLELYKARLSFWSAFIVLHFKNFT